MKKIFGRIFLFFVFFVLLIIGVDFVSNPNTWTNSRYTVYFKTCADLKSNNYDCSLGFLFGYATHLALAERQSVVIYYPNSFPVKRIDNCEVFDSKNWHCETGGTNGQALSMAHGEISDLGDGRRQDGELPVTTQISHFEYLTRSLFYDEDQAINNSTKLSLDKALKVRGMKANNP